MTILKAAATVLGIGLLSGTLLPSAKADEWDRKTVLTFSGPVEIPGVHLKGWRVLPAGTYVFKVMDSQSDRHIVQIFSEDEKTVYATILAIPNYRLKATDKTAITFTERPAGAPEALRAWFYPGRNWGEEFVYPKARAIVLAQAGNIPVLFTPAELPSEVSQPIKSADEPVVVQLKRTPIMAVQPTGEQVEVAQVVTPPPSTETQVAATPATPQETLPATASWMPFLALCGLLALSGSFALLAIRKRIAVKV